MKFEKAEIGELYLQGGELLDYLILKFQCLRAVVLKVIAHGTVDFRNIGCYSSETKNLGDCSDSNLFEIT